jgi:hypothetical protein
MEFLKDPIVREALRQAWYDSEPGVFGAHEEGGFILRDDTGRLTAVRWMRGDKAYIEVPAHIRCRYADQDIVATFHTHPNTGNSFDPEPSDDDVDGVQNDLHLRGEFYIGEFVLSKDMIYLIPPAGNWREIVPTEEILRGDHRN